MNRQTRRRLADASLALVAMLWGAGFIAVKDTLDTVPPLTLNFIRFVIAAAVMRIVLHRRLRSIRRSDLPAGLLVGLFLFLGFTSQTIGLQFTTASKQGFLTATYVVMVPFLAWAIQGVRLRIPVVLASLIALGGIGLIVLDGPVRFGSGDALSLLCALCFALHILSVERYASGMDVYMLAWLQILFATVMFGMTALTVEGVILAIVPRAWGALLFLGVFSSFLCFTLQTVAQRHTSPSHASLLLSTESLFAVLFGVMLLGETLSVRAALGGAAILAAIVWVQWEPEKGTKTVLHTTVSRETGSPAYERIRKGGTSNG